MKIHINLELSFSLFISLLFQLSVYSQNGRWVSQSVPESTNSKPLADCGETCAGVTWENSQFVYFFDIDTSQWTEVNLRNKQTFHDLVAEGQTIMAYSDSLLIGYSAITSTWDTIHFKGIPMDVNNKVPNRGYGCGENLAYFITDSAMYIFDSELGQWQKNIIPVPITPSSGGQYWSRDDYAAVINRISGSSYSLNMAYSLLSHSFSQLAEGGYYHDINFLMTHGFVSEWNDGTTCKLNGYSAVNNQFTQLILIPPDGYANCQGGPPKQVKERTVYACNYIEIVNDTIRQLRTYGFDTRLGSWTENIFEYDPREMFSGGGGLTTGGQVAATMIHNHNPKSPDYNLMTYIIYSGQNGRFSTLTPMPGLYYSTSGASGGIALGGTVGMAIDASKVWFYNIENGKSLTHPIWGDHAVQELAAEDYCTIESYESESSDSMKLYIYNGPENHCTELTVWKDYYSNPVSTYNMFLLPTGSNYDEVYIYSTFVDTFVHMNFPNRSSPGFKLNDQLAVVSSANLSYIYDATINTLHSENWRLPTNHLGTHIFACNKDNYYMGAYSTVTHRWTDFTFTENLESVSVKEYIGLVRTPSFVNKFYAYNGFHDNVIELAVTGSKRTSVVGGKTVLVVQSDTIYAFDPEKKETPVFSIEGKVLNNENTPVNKGNVELLRQMDNGYHYHLYQKKLTDSNSFTFNNIPGGYITLRCAPDTNDFPGYLTTYLGNTILWSEADFFTLDKDTAGLRVNLIPVPPKPEGTNDISGILIEESRKSESNINHDKYNGNGTPLKNIYVFLVNPDGDLFTYDVTDSVGAFEFKNIPSGHFKFLADYVGFFMDNANDSLIVSGENQKYYISAVAGNDTISIEISDITGINDLNTGQSIRIYPNPVLNELTLQFYGFKEEDNLILGIRDLNGKLLKNKNITLSPGDTSFRINTNDLPDGIYIISITGNKYSFKTRFIKLK